MNRLARYVQSLGRFIVDFFIGDTPELFVAALGLLIGTGVISKVLGLHRIAAVLLPIGLMGALGISLRRAARRAR